MEHWDNADARHLLGDLAESVGIIGYSDSGTAGWPEGIERVYHLQLAAAANPIVDRAGAGPRAFGVVIGRMASRDREPKTVTVRVFLDSRWSGGWIDRFELSIAEFLSPYSLDPAAIRQATENLRQLLAIAAGTDA